MQTPMQQNQLHQKRFPCHHFRTRIFSLFSAHLSFSLSEDWSFRSWSKMKTALWLLMFIGLLRFQCEARIYCYRCAWSTKGRGVLPKDWRKEYNERCKEDLDSIGGYYDCARSQKCVMFLGKEADGTGKPLRELRLSNQHYFRDSCAWMR
jgi:hypothetical protein